MNKNIRVRFAPSPTGPLHIGGVRTALYNYLFAHKLGGTLILRIEDTDQTRFYPGAEEYIVESLTWCGIKFDEGVHIGGPHAPYRQSERKDLYKQYADMLVDKGHAYYAFDTAEELEAIREKMKATGNSTWQYNHITRVNMKNALSLPSDEVKTRIESGEPYVIRLKVPRNEEVKLNDLIRGVVVVNTNHIDDKVLFKSDGMPTYHLANVVDDYLMQITHVIRGEEWLPSAPLHVLLYKYFGWEAVMPSFAHLPLILKPDGNGKLSKRDGDRLGFPVFPLEWKDPFTGEISSGYRESGWFSEAVVNLIALLGWHPANNQEVFSMDELIEAFSLDRVSKAGAKFDLDKARWFNQHYLRQYSSEALAKLIINQYAAESLSPDMNHLSRVIDIIKERAIYIGDLFKDSIYFFKKPEAYETQSIAKKWKPETTSHIHALITIYQNLSDFSPNIIETETKQWLANNNIAIGGIMPVIRILLTGSMAGPTVFEIASLLGREETISRLENGLSIIEAELNG
ncbi:MAG: glutamate--tRNA ligase [Flavobacteriales bacterium]|nr:glutamate--tRNA ligase [Flavobacteriales bacterium]